MILIVIGVLGSFASMIGLGVSLYVLWREVKISDEVHVLKTEEESWHNHE